MSKVWVRPLIRIIKKKKKHSTGLALFDPLGSGLKTEPHDFSQNSSGTFRLQHM